MTFTRAYMRQGAEFTAAIALAQAQALAAISDPAVILSDINLLLGAGWNLCIPGNITDSAYLNSSGAVITAGAASYFIAANMIVSPGMSVISNFPTASGTYAKWKDANGAIVGAAFAIAAGVPITAPAGAVRLDASFAKVAGNVLLGQAVSVKQALIVVAGTTVPADYRSGGAVDEYTAARRGRQATRKASPLKADFYERAEATQNTLMTASGSASSNTGYDTTGKVRVTPNKGLALSCDFSPGSSNFGWNWFNDDDVRVGSSTASVTADITAGQFTFAVTSAGTLGPLSVGMPISATGIPARSWVSAVPATGPGTTGVYTFTNDAGAPATATNTGVAMTAGGALGRVPITPPPGAAYGITSFPSARRYDLVVTDEAMTGALAAPTNQFSGAAYLKRADSKHQSPFAGDDFAFIGNSKMQDATGANSMQAGLERYLRCNGLIFGGVSGRKMMQYLDGSPGGTYSRGPTSAYGAGDFATVRGVFGNGSTNDFGIRNASAGTTGDPALVWPLKDCSVLGALGDTWTPTTFNAVTTAGQRTLSSIVVSRGALANGMPVRGNNIPQTCTLVTTDGGATWSLSDNALSSGSNGMQGGTFYGDLYDVWIRKLQAWNTAMQLFAATAPQRFDDYLNHGSYTGRPGDPLNARGLYLSDYVAAELAFYGAWGIPCFDAFRRLGINAVNHPLYLGDGLHENAIGYQQLTVPRHGRFINANAGI